jgi:hypothetical protein
MSTVLTRIAELLKMTEPASATGMLFVHGTSVPSDGVAGYAAGCIFLHIDGGAGDALYVNEGSLTSCDFNPLVGGVTATAAEMNVLDGAILGTGLTAGTGITDGVGTVYKCDVKKVGSIYKTSIVIDLTGLHSTASGDIIGIDGTAKVCHIGQITAAVNGTIYGGWMVCSEKPAGGEPDIDWNRGWCHRFPY